MKNDIAIISLGCNKNLVDSEIMAGYLRQGGFALIKEPAEAEVIIVNTCGFIESAKQEAIDTILEMAQYKKNGACRALIVTGCLAQRYAPQLREQLPEADAILGVYDYDRITETVQKALAGERSVFAAGSAEYLDTAARRVLSTPPGTAYLKIAEGCDNRCAYCAIPGIRGSYTSRRLKSLLEEAAFLRESGVKELILTAQDTTRYGEDQGKNRFTELLEKLAAMDFHWIRVLYAYPSRVSDALLELMDNTPNICKYLDMPIQHTHDEMLKSMNRHYRQADVLRIYEKVRSFQNPWALRTTLITGFPGEQKKHFAHMLDFIEKHPFDNLGAFAYSREEDTPAALLPHQCRRSTAELRKDAVMLRQGEIAHTLNQKRIGNSAEVLTEGYDREQKLCYGRTEFLAPEVDGKVFFTCEKACRPGEIVTVHIDDAFGYDFYGACENEPAK